MTVKCKTWGRGENAAGQGVGPEGAGLSPGKEAAGVFPETSFLIAQKGWHWRNGSLFLFPHLLAFEKEQINFQKNDCEQGVLGSLADKEAARRRLQERWHHMQESGDLLPS